MQIAARAQAPDNTANNKQHDVTAEQHSNTESDLAITQKALAGLGVPEYEAKRYEGHVKNGGILLSVHCNTSDDIKRSKGFLRATGAEDISSFGEASGDRRVYAPTDVTETTTRF